jgi:hypothetical protein
MSLSDREPREGFRGHCCQVYSCGAESEELEESDAEN